VPALERRTAGRHLLADREPDDPLVVHGRLGHVLGILADRPDTRLRDELPLIAVDQFDHGDQGIRRRP